MTKPTSMSICLSPPAIQSGIPQNLFCGKQTKYIGGAEVSWCNPKYELTDVEKLTMVYHGTESLSHRILSKIFRNN